MEKKPSSMGLDGKFAVYCCDRHRHDERVSGEARRSAAAAGCTATTARRPTSLANVKGSGENDEEYRKEPLVSASRVLDPPGPLQVERLPDGRRKLLSPLHVDLCDQKHPFVVHVPKDFVTDFSSMPGIARVFIRWSRVDIAGVVHDCLYRKGVTAVHQGRQKDGRPRLARGRRIRPAPSERAEGGGGLQGPEMVREGIVS